MKLDSIQLDTKKFGGNQIAAGGELVAKLEAALLSAVTLPTKEEFLDLVGQSYDRFIAPIDIPYVPNTIEPAFDIVLKSLCVKSASALYDRVAKNRAAA